MEVELQVSERITAGQLRVNEPLNYYRSKSTAATSPMSGVSFQDIFNRTQVKFSNHAEQRLQQRGINVDGQMIQKLQGAIDQAAQKGAKDSLVLVNNIAMIVNIPSRTVVTAMTDQAMHSNIFTKIDSAVIIP